MSTNMSQPPPPSMPPGAPPPSGGGGYGPFSEEEIQQMMIDTGYDRARVCQTIDQTGATTKEQAFPQIYSGSGIQPQSETVGPGAVQGQPPSAPGANPMQMPPGAAPARAMPQEAGEGEPPQSAPTEAAEHEGIDPKVAQAMHAMMAPKKRPPGR